ncbi:MAG: hypothetical protein SWH61_16680 [Thermodesulfobacteriota bacterium]|nr:hypothetical protein [Thermodesulfobacteriota bacterium]
MNTFDETAAGLRLLLRNLEKLAVLGETIHQMVKSGLAEQSAPLIQKRAGILLALQQQLDENKSLAETPMDPELMPLFSAVMQTRRRVLALDKAIATILENEKTTVLAEQKAAAAALTTLRKFIPFYLKEASQVSLTA